MDATFGHDCAGGVITRPARLLTVELPFPDSSLMPNRKNGKHWSATHAAKGEAWKLGYYLTHQAAQAHKGIWFPTDGRVPVTLTYCSPDKRHRDLDNLLAASKAILDGVAAALLMDDREFEPVTLKRGPVRKGGAMLLEVGA